MGTGARLLICALGAAALAAALYLTRPPVSPEGVGDAPAEVPVPPPVLPDAPDVPPAPPRGEPPDTLALDPAPTESAPPETEATAGLPAALRSQYLPETLRSYEADDPLARGHSASAAPGAPRSGGGLGERIDVSFARTAPDHPAAPDGRGASGEADLRVPVSERIDLRPGFQVDYEDGPEEERPSVDTRPNVGVEVKF